MKKSIFLLLFLSFFIGCNDIEIPDRPFPRVRTLEVTNVNTSGATFNAEILKLNGKEITEFGFVWGSERSLDLKYSNKFSHFKNLESNKFKAEITSALQADKEYYVKAYIKTKEHAVLGDYVTFISRGSTNP